MSEGKLFISSVLQSASTTLVRALPDDLFFDDELPIVEFVRQHLRAHSQLPTIATVQQRLRVRLPEAVEPPSYYVDRLYDRRLFVSMREAFPRFRDAMQAMDMAAVRREVAAMHAAARTSQAHASAKSLSDAAQDMLQEYDRAAATPGMIGVPSGWPTLDEATGGYQNGDLVSWIARMSIGKTMLLLRQASHARLNGYKTLFISMEMPISALARRVAALEAGFDPDMLRKGRVGYFGRRRLQRYASSIAIDDNMVLFANTRGTTTADVENLVEEEDPDIIYIDSAYLLKPVSAPRNAGRYERIAYTFDEVKQLTISADRPVVITSQFSKTAGKKGKDGSMESIAFSDVLAMHSSIVLKVGEGEPPYEKTRREIEFMKGREGEQGSLRINFGFAPVNFLEIPEEESAVTAQSGVSLDWVPE